MSYNLLGKKVRGRFAFPSGVVATNSDTALWMLDHIPQIGAVVGKSTTIEPRLGNREDIFVQPTAFSGWNAVAFTNPGLEDAIAGFQKLKKAYPNDVFMMPQIGESSPDSFAHCIKVFEKSGVADGYEANLSCPHATQGGVALSQPDTVKLVFEAMRGCTDKPLVAKLNASMPDLECLVRAALAGGATAISLINTLPGPNPELKNKFGGLSGPVVFPVLCDTIKKVRGMTDAPLLAMGGIASAADIRQLERLDANLFYEIGTALAEMDSEEIARYFAQLERDLKEGTDLAKNLTDTKKALQYKPFIIKEVIEYNENLRLLKFYEKLDAGTGQFVFVKSGDSRQNEDKKDDEFSKPFSVASDRDGLELVIRKVGKATEQLFTLQKNQVVRIKGPYGKTFSFPESDVVVFVGAGCGIAPIYNAAQHYEGKKIFVLGAKNAKELPYVKEFEEMGEVVVSTDDGSQGYHGFVSDLLADYLLKHELGNISFFNCGPEVAMAKADVVEKQYASPERVFHLIERMTCCGVGICGKCSTPEGHRACVDGPVFGADDFTPGVYTRDKTGKKIIFSK
ncbi:MAG: hypothetical protein HQK83_19200 [Fibrobacteria bacterium]|nr:hypothetical protein [Fibrobacteria bacterium]